MRITGIENEMSDGFGELEFLIGLLEEESPSIGCELSGIKLDGESFSVEGFGCGGLGDVIHCVSVVGVWECCKLFNNNTLTQRPLLIHNAT